MLSFRYNDLISIKLEILLMDASPDEDNEDLKVLIERIDKELKKADAD